MDDARSEKLKMYSVEDMVMTFDAVALQHSCSLKGQLTTD